MTPEQLAAWLRDHPASTVSDIMAAIDGDAADAWNLIVRCPADLVNRVHGPHGWRFDAA